MRRVTRLSIIMLFFSLVFAQPELPTASAQEAKPCEPSSPASSEVTESDKMEIIKLTLMTALVEKLIPDHRLLTERSRRIVISTENIKASWIPTLSHYKLIPLERREIQKRADRSRDFLYLAFSEFRVNGSCVAVTLVNSWAVGKNSGMGYLSGGGFTYEYRRQSGKWVGKWISGWISQGRHLRGWVMRLRKEANQPIKLGTPGFFPAFRDLL